MPNGGLSEKLKPNNFSGDMLCPFEVFCLHLVVEARKDFTNVVSHNTEV